MVIPPLYVVGDCCLHHKVNTMCHCSAKCHRFAMKGQLIMGQRGTIQPPSGISDFNSCSSSTALAVTNVFPGKGFLRNPLESGQRWSPLHHLSWVFPTCVLDPRLLILSFSSDDWFTDERNLIFWLTPVAHLLLHPMCPTIHKHNDAYRWVMTQGRDSSFHHS